MKRIFISFLLLSTFISIQPVQAFQSGSFNKGIKFGLNKSRYYRDESTGSFELKEGFCGGIFINFRISKSIYIQPECLYTTKGSKNDVLVYAEHTDDQGQPILLGIDMQTSYIDYIEFPFLLKLAFSSKSLIIPVLYFGPYYSIKLNSKYKIGNLSEGNLIISDDDYGLIAGLGIFFNTEALPLTLEARYVYGMSELENNDIPDIKNEVLSVMIGFHL